MAASSYDAALTRLLQHEGGYTNHPSDPGGPTNFGITIYDYRKYIKADGTAMDVKNMRLEDAKKIYKAKYWDAIKGDQLEPGVDYVLFDYAVNSGIGRAGTVLRRVLNLPTNTTVINSEVVKKANELRAVDLVDLICTERLTFLTHLKTWPVFGKGWGRRVKEVRLYGTQIAKDLPWVDSPSVQPAPGRGSDIDLVVKVRALQIKLAKAGFDPGAADGDLGPKTIKAFQRYKGLNSDGVVGIKTKPLLQAELALIEPHAEVHADA